jgi:hypothetical protein
MFFTFCIVVVEVEVIVVVVVKVAVMEEEGVVLCRGPSVLCPFEGEQYCGVGAPFGPNLHQHKARSS